jgi:hypothetical protein
MPRVPDGALAQLGERYTGSVEVSGSIPLGSTNPPAETGGLRRSSETKAPGSHILPSLCECLPRSLTDVSKIERGVIT